MNQPLPSAVPYGNSHLHDIISHAALFKDIPETTSKRIMNACQLSQEPKGKMLFLHGDEVKVIHFISSGWVKLFRETIDGTEAVVDVLTSGHIIGDSALFDGDVYNTSAEVVEAAAIYTFPATLLHELIKSEPSLALNLLSSMARHRREQSMEIEHLSIQNAPQRIGCFLLRLCPVEQNHNIILHLPYDKTLIASRLGMKAETFSRALAKLRSEIDIVIQGATVTIENKDRLVQYTCNNCSSSYPCSDLA